MPPGGPRVKIKSKVVKATLANKDVLDMFQGVLGTSEGAATLSVTHPKYLRIQGHVERFIRLLDALHGSSAMSLDPGPNEHLEGYVAALKKQFKVNFCAPDFTQWLAPPAGGSRLSAEAHVATAEDYAKIPAELVAEFGEVFTAAKKCSLVNTVIVVCKNLIAHKKSIGDQAALKDRFLTKGAGTVFAPLPDLPQVNFKQLYIDDRLTPGDKEFILVVLHKLYTIGHDTYEAVSAPDVDVGEFVEVIMSSIGEVKKHIPRCDQAFQKIVESVALLKGNFGGYYKDYAASGNPTIIMENFVLDVSKNTKSSPTVTAQFRRIIAHYRKLASQQATNPQLQSLFTQVDANFQELDKNSRRGAESEDESEDESEAAPEPAVAAPARRNAGRNRRKKAARARKASARAVAAGALPGGAAAGALPGAAAGALPGGALPGGALPGGALPGGAAAGALPGGALPGGAAAGAQSGAVSREVTDLLASLQAHLGGGLFDELDELDELDGDAIAITK